MTMKQEKKRIYLRAALALAALLVVLLALDNLSFVPSMLLTVLRKGAIYALVAVSMNLLNGFTGLFSLGQAGFMLLGAYTYAIPHHSRRFAEVHLSALCKRRHRLLHPGTALQTSGRLRPAAGCSCSA